MSAADLPRVSCLILSYRFERFIVRAIESALAQDYPRELLQVVVVDDGSPDRTPALVAPYRDRLVYVRQPHGGLVSAFNRGLAEVDGEILMLLSGDDEWPPDRVRTHVAALIQRPQVALVYSDMEVIDADGRVIEPSFWAATGHRPRRGRVLGPLLRGNFISGGALSVRMTFRERFAPLPADCAWEDWWIAARIAEVAEIDYLPIRGYRYRWHGRNMNLGASGERALELLRRELPFRRKLLGEFDLSSAQASDIAAGVAAFLRSLELVAERAQLPVEELLTVDDAARRRASLALDRGRSALAAGAIEPAMRLAARAIAANPFGSAEIELFRALCAQIGVDPVAPRWLQQPASAERDARTGPHPPGAWQHPPGAGPHPPGAWQHPPGAEPHPPGAGQQFELRANALLVPCDALLADRSLLSDYRELVAGDDPVTLVVLLRPGQQGQIERLERAAAEAALDDPQAPDLLALTEPSDEAGWRSLVASVHACFVARPEHPCCASLPVIGKSELARFLDIVRATREPRSARVAATSRSA